MIAGIGVDIVEVDRLQSWASQPALLDRFFHPRELAACRRGLTYSCMSLAARFAAKEALGKALGGGMRGLVLRDIELVADELGKPSLQLHAGVGTLLEKAGIEKVHVSVSHERSCAIAMVVLEG